MSAGVIAATQRRLRRKSEARPDDRYSAVATSAPIGVLVPAEDDDLAWTAQLTRIEIQANMVAAGIMGQRQPGRVAIFRFDEASRFRAHEFGAVGVHRVLVQGAPVVPGGGAPGDRQQLLVVDQAETVLSIVDLQELLQRRRQHHSRMLLQRGEFRCGSARAQLHGLQAAQPAQVLSDRFPISCMHSSGSSHTQERRRGRSAAGMTGQ